VGLGKPKEDYSHLCKNLPSQFASKILLNAGENLYNPFSLDLLITDGELKLYRGVLE